MANQKPTPHGRKLVTGDFAALERALIEQVRELRAADPIAPLVVLVPTSLLRTHLSRRLAESGIAHVNVRFLTFANVVREAARGACDATRLTPLSPEAAEVLMRRAVFDVLPGGYFDAVANQPGLAGALLRTVTDLKEALFEPADIDRALNGRTAAPPLDDRARDKLRAIAAAWRRYEDFKAQYRRVDDADLHRLAARHIADWPMRASAIPLLVYGIYDLKGIQFELLRALVADRAAIFYFPYEATPAFDYARPTYDALVRDGFRAVAAPGVSAGRPALAALGSRLFVETAQPAVSLDDSVAIVSVPGDTAELDEVARTVVDIARQGQAFHEVGILMRRTDHQAAGLLGSLERCGAKPYAPAARPLGHTRAGRSLWLLFEMLRSEYDRRAVLEFVTFADLDFERLVGDPEPATARWDALSMQAAVVGGRGEWETKLAQLAAALQRDRRGREADEDDEEYRGANVAEADARAVAQLRRCVAALFDSLEWLRTAPSWRERTDRLLDVWTRLIRIPAAEPTAADDSPGDPATGAATGTPAREYEQVEQVIRGLAALSDLDPPMDWAFFARLLDASLERGQIGCGRFHVNGPTVIDLMQARGVPFRTVLLPGMVERRFPEPAGPDPLLLDAEREWLNGACGRSAGPGELPLKRRRAAEERLLFRLAVAAATERLILLFPRIESETGRVRVASSFLLKVLSALGTDPVTYESLDGSSAGAWPGLRHVAAGRRAVSAGRAVTLADFDVAAALEARQLGDTGTFRALAQISRHLDGAIAAESYRWHEHSLTIYDGVIHDPRLLDKLQRRHAFDKPISPTRLEQYAKCPFQYFLRSVLRIEARAEPTRAREPVPSKLGQTMHRILADLFRELAADWPPELPHAIERLRAIAAAHFERFERSGLAGAPLVWRVRRAQRLGDLERLLVSELARLAGSVPTEFELEFGVKNQPVRLPLDNLRELSFHGRIDRVDVRDDRTVLITDYKGKGLPVLGADSLGAGRAMQLAIYLLGAAAAMPGVELEDLGGGAYVSYRNAKTAQLHVTETLWDRLRHICRVLVQSIHQGLFPQNPSSRSCEQCDFARVCMGLQHSLFDLKQADPCMAAYHGLSDRTAGVPRAGEEAADA